MLLAELQAELGRLQSQIDEVDTLIMNTPGGREAFRSLMAIPGWGRRRRLVSRPPSATAANPMPEQHSANNSNPATTSPDATNRDSGCPARTSTESQSPSPIGEHLVGVDAWAAGAAGRAPNWMFSATISVTLRLLQSLVLPAARFELPFDEDRRAL